MSEQSVPDSVKVALNALENAVWETARAGTAYIRCSERWHERHAEAMDAARNALLAEVAAAVKAAADLRSVSMRWYASSMLDEAANLKDTFGPSGAPSATELSLLADAGIRDAERYPPAVPPAGGAP